MWCWPYLVGLLALSTHVFAQNCESEVSAHWLVKESMELTPTLLEERTKIAQFEAYDVRARQKINPEFEYFAVGGREFTFSNPYLMSESRFWMNFQLGDKIQKKVLLNNKDFSHSRMELDHKKIVHAKLSLKEILALSQLKQELAQYNFSIKVLNNILSKYEARKYLAPEQKVEVSITKIARDDFLLKQKIVEKRKEAKVLALRESLGFACHFQDVNVRSDSMEFPAEVSFMEAELAENLELKLWDQKISYKQAQLDLENAKAIPDLRFGPMAQTYTNEKNSFVTVGLALVMPLPLFDRNIGGRQLATAGIAQASEERRLHLEKIHASWQQKQEQYQTLRQALSSEGMKDDLKIQLQEALTLFSQGKISMNLLIELQRQMVQLKESYHLAELELFGVLLDLYELAGKLDHQKILDFAAGI